MTSTIQQNPVVERAIAADRKRRRDKKIDAVLRFVGHLLAVLLRGWLLMLAVGVIHHEWIPTCPTVSYGVATALAVLISGALVPVPTRSDPKGGSR